jgi:hypothetical protein
MRLVVNATPLQFYSQEGGPVPIVQDTAWAPAQVWTGAKNLAPSVFDSRAAQFLDSRYTD